MDPEQVEQALARAARRARLWRRRMARRYREGLPAEEQSATWHEACLEAATYERRIQTQARLLGRLLG